MAAWQPSVCLVYNSVFPTLPTSIVLNQIPPTSQLLHISWLDNRTVPTNAPHTPNSATQPVFFGGWITLIPPPKLCKKITEAHYIDMAKLCPEHLEALNVAEEDHSKSSSSKPKDISSILDWIQAFMWFYCQKISTIVFQVPWHTSITDPRTTTLNLSSSIGHPMTVSFAKKPLHVLN